MQPIRTGARRLATLSIAALAGLLAPLTAVAEPAIQGVWRNPKNTVHLEIRDCGPNACGYVVWANADVRADARERGFKDMIGMQLLRDFKEQRNGDWRGKVFVPSMGMTFSGTAAFINPGALRAKGCALGAFFCKSQVWTRVASASAAGLTPPRP